MYMMMEAEEVGWDCFENRDISCNTEITERDFSLRQMGRNVKQTGGKKGHSLWKVNNLHSLKLQPYFFKSLST